MKLLAMYGTGRQFFHLFFYAGILFQRSPFQVEEIYGDAANTRSFSEIKVACFNDFRYDNQVLFSVFDST
ncbi:hypothetical protein SAMN05216352_102446 [Alteribacillus bidgolensis]|uniref:Uncharacterized protein n=1 Tax=Alteribacillus bidgolensis TaxID=930129 RepID=A0A1G8EZC0_9BACI|nr:hypothetical protein SAMN05216352_102446 [Alteribacillus bidgolensis]